MHYLDVTQEAGKAFVQRRIEGPVVMWAPYGTARKPFGGLVLATATPTNP